MVSGHTSPAAVAGTTIAFTVLAVLVVSLRLFTRLLIVRNAGLDDIFIFASLASSIGLAVCTCLEVRFGLGQHSETIPLEHQIYGLKALYAAIILYNASMSCTKYSILLQYWRVFTQDKFRIGCIVLMITVGIYTCWTIFSAIFLCWPIAGFWDVTMTDVKCLSKEAVWFANAGINIVTDIATAILPLPFLSTLQISKRQKAALMVVFGLAGFTCVISILRLESVYVISTSKDPDWDNALAALWSVVEVNTGILCSCLPPLKALVSRFFPRAFTSYHQTSVSGKYGSRNAHNQGKLGRDEFAQHLSGRRGVPSHSNVSRGSQPFDGMNMDELASSPKDIQVVTVVQQEVERGLDESSRSEHGSTRHLVLR